MKKKQNKSKTLLEAAKKIAAEDMKRRGTTEVPQPMDPTVGKLNPCLMFFRMIDDGIPQEEVEKLTGIRSILHHSPRH